MERQLIDYLREQGYKVGDRLPSIRQLSQSFGASPSVVRDALMSAQTKGLVRIQPRSGAYVQSLDYSNFVDVLTDTLETGLMQKDPNLFHLIEFRTLVEVESAGLAAAQRRPEDLVPILQALEDMNDGAADRHAFIRADERFHLAIAGITRNSVLVTVLESLLILLRPNRAHLVLNEAERKLTQHLHERIYQYILDGDVEGSRLEMREHTQHGQRILLALPAKPSGSNETVIGGMPRTAAA